jgi:hypothetical protein
MMTDPFPTKLNYSNTWFWVLSFDEEANQAMLITLINSGRGKNERPWHRNMCRMHL